MNQLLDNQIIVSAAPISGPDRESSCHAGRQAGEEDRQANVVTMGDEVPVAKVRRITERYLTDHDLIDALAERDKGGPIAQAQAAARWRHRPGSVPGQAARPCRRRDS